MCRLFKIHKSNFLKWNDRRMLKFQILGNSSTRKKLRTPLAEGNLCRQQLQERNFKIWSWRTISTWQRSSIFLHKKLGTAEAYPTFSMAALKTDVLIWGMFMASSMRVAIHLGPNYLVNLKVHKTTNFDEIQSLFNITQNLILEHSKEILNVYTIDSASPSWTRSVLSHDQVIQWTKAKGRVHSDSVLCLEKPNGSEGAIERWEGRVDEFKMSPFFQRIAGNWWRRYWVRLEYSPRIFLHCRFFWLCCDDMFGQRGGVSALNVRLSLSLFRIFQEELREWNIELERFTDWIIFMSMFNDIDWTRKRKRWNLYCEFRKKVKEYAERSCKDTGRFWVPVVWNSSLHAWRKMGFHSLSDGGAIQRHRSSSIQGYPCFESWNSEEEEWERHHLTLQRGCFEPRALVPNHSLCKSAQFLRNSYDLVWTKRHDRRKRDKRSPNNPWPQMN